MKKLVLSFLAFFIASAALAVSNEPSPQTGLTKDEAIASQVIAHKGREGIDLQLDPAPPIISIPATEGDDGTLQHTNILIAGTPVVSSPYYGVQTEFSGGDLLVNASTVNKDIALLGVRKAFYQALTKHGIIVPEHTIIELSGLIETQVFFRDDFTRGYQSDIDLTAAEVDIFAGVNRWVSALLQMEIDGSRATGIPKRVSNSRIVVGSAFVTFGNLNELPLYATIGQLYVPFGQYSSALPTRSTARDLGRTKARPLVLGLKTTGGPHTWNASVYGFQGDTKKGGSLTLPQDHINAVGGNIYYGYHGDKWYGNAGVSVINNLAESDGMQGGAFGITQATEVINHRVPGLNLRGKLGYESVHILGEYVGATRHFSSMNLSYKSSGARPEAFHVEGVYSFTVGEQKKPGNVAIGYDHTREAIALGLPQDRYSASISYAPWRATIFSLEYRHDENYSTSYLPAAVQGVAIPTAALGKDADTVTLQMDIFF